MAGARGKAGAGAGAGSGEHGAASPGLLRRRYSVPETVMRKYKLAQQKSDSDESEVGSAPSPRGWSPARRGGARGLMGVARPSPLLRRLWGRQGGSHSELRYWDSCSASSDCEACRKLSEKSIPAVIRTESHPASPSHKLYRTSRSPKKLIPFASQGFSPERYITHLENTRDMLLRESKSQITSPSLLASASTPSERSSFKTASLTEGSPKLRLSSLATSSYPTTDGTSVSDVTSEITRSSTSYSSDDVTHSRSKISKDRPGSAVVSSTNELYDTVSEAQKKRRKSVCIYMNSFDSPTVEIISAGVTDSSAILSQESSSNADLGTSNADRSSSQDPTYTDDSFVKESTSTQPSTTSSEKTTSTETSNVTSSTLNRETSSPSDSAVSTRSSITTSSKTADKDNSQTSTASSVNQKYEGDDQHYRNQNMNNLEFSDTGISETFINDCDSNKNYINSMDESDHNMSKSGSISNSDNMSTTDKTSDLLTSIENPAYKLSKHANLRHSKVECLEVVVSETLNSSAFLNNDTFGKNKEISDNQKHSSGDEKLDKVKTLNKDNILKPHCNMIDIDQYVSNILIDSLNTMTDQINEINFNTEDEFKLSILEKEIKVKLQNVCASPINLPTNNIITSLITHMPDKDLLETTIIEEQTQSLSYSTESTCFPTQNQSELQESTRSAGYTDENNSYYLENDMSNIVEDNILRYSDMMQPEDRLLNVVADITSPVETENSNNNGDTNMYTHNAAESMSNNAQFYLNDSQQNTTDHENNINTSFIEHEKPSKTVLQKLNKMFENSSQSLHASMDSNYNICIDDSANNYFCGSDYRDVSHLEMSTDVDVFVDNSLNKMMNSIDIEYSASELRSDIQNLSPENKIPSSEIADNSADINNSHGNTKSKKTSPENTSDVNMTSNIISNIMPCLYQKPQQVPIVVPRFSAVPYSESMEVNTSSEEEASSCESDCLSMVDSLDDPNSPRLREPDHRIKRKISKHDNKPVRGDIMLLLPENSNNKACRLPKDKSETFFVPIKEDSIECEKDNIVVAEHMPEKIKDKLFKRQQKRELRKEHFKRKKNRQMKRDLENQKLAGIQRLRDEHEKECFDILTQIIDEVVEKVSKGGSNKIPSKSKSPVKKANQDMPKLKTNDKKPPHKTEKKPVKDDKNVKDFESFVIDKQGNIQLTHFNKLKEQRASKKESGDKKIEKSYYQKNNSLKQDSNNTYVQNNLEYQQPSYNPNLSGPRRLYQKTEFEEGNKHVEILEIVECIDSSPEPQSDDNRNYLRGSRKIKKSKIPVPVAEKSPSKISKNEHSLKSSLSRSPVNVIIPPYNILAAKNDQNNIYNHANSEMDQIIANILIDALNEDDNQIRKNQTSLSSPRKPVHPTVKKLASTADISGRRVSIPQQNHEKIATIPKYKQKFDAIPEERSSLSIESSNEDMSKANRRPSLPAEGKLLQQTNKTHDFLHMDNSGTYQGKDMNVIPEIDENITTEQLNLKSSPSIIIPQAQIPGDLVKSDVQTQSTPYTKSIDIHDVSTSPMTQYVSIATSPIPTENTQHESSGSHVKGKKALANRHGWAGFFQPHSGYSPEHEGSHPTSNTHSDREAVEKTNTDIQVKDSAPHSQRILRTMDSRNNIRQINIHHKPPIPDKPNVVKIREISSEFKTSRNIGGSPKNASDDSKHSGENVKSEGTTGSPEKYSKLTERFKYTTNFSKHKKGYNITPEIDNTYPEKTAHGKTSQKKVEIHLQKSASNESVEHKRVRLPSPFMNQSFSRSTDTTSSGSDSEVAVNCPALVPRFPPNNLRQRRNINRKSQRKEEPFRLPYQNVAGGWSVTLAGSCYTTLPSDVEMKVVFPKNSQQGTSQSDSGLGEEHNNYRKPKAPGVVCKKCGSGENVCQSCHTLKSCTCLSSMRIQEAIEKENESFLPPALIRKVNKNVSIAHEGSLEQLGGSAARNFQYLPDVNSPQAAKSKSKKSMLKMARRFSLHCWLPEDKLPGRPKLSRMELSQQSLGNENEEGLSVFGSAIRPEEKPRVPTMSERDLTRMHTSHFYSRNRRL